MIEEQCTRCESDSSDTSEFDPSKTYADYDPLNEDCDDGVPGCKCGLLLRQHNQEMLDAATDLPSFESAYNVQSRVINASDVVPSEVDGAYRRLPLRYRWPG